MFCENTPETKEQRYGVKALMEGSVFAINVGPQRYYVLLYVLYRQRVVYIFLIYGYIDTF